MSDRPPGADRAETRRESGRERPGSYGAGGAGGAGQNGRHHGKTSGWEWAIAGLGALVVLATVGFLLYEAATSPPTPPELEAIVESVVDTERGYVVEFRIRNHGQQTAAGLLVEGELRSDTGVVEKAEATIDYVPGQSSRRGGFVFTHDPARFALEIRPRGYDRP